MFRRFLPLAIVLACTRLALGAVIAHWTFDKGIGSTLDDVSGNGHDGTITGAVWDTGVSGTALRFNGTTDYVTVPSSSVLAPPDAITAEVWVCLESYGTGQLMEIVAKWGAAGWDNDSWAIYFDKSRGNRAVFAVSTGSQFVLPASDSALPLHEWVFLAGVWDGTYARMYVNGVAGDSVAWTGGLNSSNSEPLYIGRNGHSDFFTNGKIDEVRILDVGLTGQQVMDRYNSVLQDSSLAPVLIPVPSPTLERRPLLTWHTVDSTNTYTVAVDTSTNFASPLIVVPVADTFYLPGADLPIGTIYWRVKANSYRYSQYSSFRIQSADVPFLIPYEPKVTEQRRPTLQWYEVTSATTYTLAIDDDVSFADPIASVMVSDTFYTLAADLPTEMIYWRVRSDLDTMWSGIDSFYIQPDSIPVMLRFDGDKVGSSRPTFAWHPVSGATSYRIQIADNPAFSGTMTIPISDTTYAPGVDLALGLWYWRVSSSRDFSLYPPADSLDVDQLTFVAANGDGNVAMAGCVRQNAVQGVRIFDVQGRLLLRGRRDISREVGVYVLQDVRRGTTVRLGHRNR